MGKATNTVLENDTVLPKIQIEWDRLNTEVNERLYVLQRAQALYVEIELLDQRIQTTLDRVDSILQETSASSKSFQQIKVHLNKLKVKQVRLHLSATRCSSSHFQQIEIDQRKSAEHDMAICQKRREEFITILRPWYEMNWSKYIDLSKLQTRVEDTFEVSSQTSSISVFRSRSF
jgi:predicted  nucleic acid-binding Zn-ribbon protein